MATKGLAAPTAPPGSAATVIDISSASERATPTPTEVPKDASRVIPTKPARPANSQTRPQNPQNHPRQKEVRGQKTEDSEEEDDDDDDEDDFSDSDSFIEDLICGEEVNKEDQKEAKGEYCTEEEARAFRKKLHAVGVEQFVAETIEAGTVSAKKLITAFGVKPPKCFEGRTDSGYYRVLGILLMREWLKRQKLPQYNTVDDVVELLRKARNVMVITGAGISTNLGIPDFRSEKSGFYSKLKALGFDDPQQVFDLHVFREDPSIFYENCGDTFPIEGLTSPTHAFIALLQEKEKLLRNYTQNIDNIEAAAGIREDKLIQCHGSWAKATCQKCSHKVDGSEIMPDVKSGTIPKCKKCIRDIAALKPQRQLSSANRNGTGNGHGKRKRGGYHPSSSSTNHKHTSKSRRRRSSDEDFYSSSGHDSDDEAFQPGIMKPDITFFHEQLPNLFFDRFNNRDKKLVDLVFVIGTSMSVAPVSEIPMALDRNIPHVYISNKVCGDHIEFDVTLLGDCDVIVSELSRRCGWELRHKLVPEGRGVRVTQTDRERAVWAFEVEGTGTATGTGTAIKVED